MFYPQCGVETIPGARYCAACGRALPVDHVQPTEGREQSRDVPPPHGAMAPAAQVAADPGDPMEGRDPEPTVIPFPARPVEPASQQPTTAATVQAGGDGQAREGDLSERPRVKLSRPAALTWLAALSVALVLALGIGRALALTEVSRRDETIADYQRQVAALTGANLAYQDQVDGLVGERDRLAQERAALSGERDALVAERDTLNATIKDLEATVAEYEKQVADLNARLGEQGRQLAQAREEASRQQTRAEEAEAFGVIMSQVVALDDEIHEEFGRFFVAVLEMQDAYYQRNSLAFENAFYRAEQSRARLDQLFAERDRLLAQLGY